MLVSVGVAVEVLLGVEVGDAVGVSVGVVKALKDVWRLHSKVSTMSII